MVNGLAIHTRALQGMGGFNNLKVTRPFPTIYQLPGLNFHRAQFIFVIIVAVLFFDGKTRVGVIRPAAAQIKAFINPADFVFTRQPQRYGVIFTVAHIGKTDLTDEWPCQKRAARPCR